MAQSNAKQQLVDFLDRKAFKPVLEASPGDYPAQADRDTLEAVQRATQDEQRRYRENYDSAEEVRDNFHDDLSSDEAEEVQRDLRHLGLPTLSDFESDFDRRCQELGVSSSSSS